MSKDNPAKHPLNVILDQERQVYSSIADGLIREINHYLPRQGMWDLFDWQSPPPIEDLEGLLRAKLEIARYDYDEQTAAMKVRRDELIEQIRVAFADVSLGKGISISQAYVIDDYGGDKEQQLARNQDTESHWSEVDVDAKDPGGSAMSFMDAEGFRFYVPAYMTDYLRCGFLRFGDCSNSNAHMAIMRILDSKLAKDQGYYDILSLEQKRCVAEFLLFVYEMADKFDSADALTGLRRHWLGNLPTELQAALI